MKKSKLLVLGLIALMLVAGLALASCGEFCPGGDGVVSGSCTNGSIGNISQDCTNSCISKQMTADPSKLDYYCNCDA
jgi:hypothetical protein